MLLSDVNHIMGSRHPICSENVYVDGVKMAVPSSGRRGLKQGVDQLIIPEMVAGIETYGFGEVPPNFMKLPEGTDITGRQATVAIGSYFKCVTLIWLK